MAKRQLDFLSNIEPNLRAITFTIDPEMPKNPASRKNLRIASRDRVEIYKMAQLIRWNISEESDRDFRNFVKSSNKKV